MIKRTLFALVALALALALAPAAAQDFPGYPPSGYLNIGQGTAAPAWLPNPGLLISNNLSDLTNAASARTNLGLGTLAQQNANAVAITGGTMTGLPTPTLPGDVATKLYVDSVAAGLVVHAAVTLATAIALPANTYNNGAAGVGATLTANANGALTVDGIAVGGGNRILVKNEAAAANNGIYTVTQVGSGATPWVLTRATDANAAAAGNAGKLGLGSYVLVLTGSTLINTGWIVNAPIATIGVDPVSFVQFSGNITGVASLNGLTGALSLTTGGGININPSGASITITGALPLPQGRLTLQSHTPVMTTSQVAKSTIFYDCYRGGSVPVFNGTIDTLLPIPACEVSTTLQASGSGVINNAGVFDVWGINVGGSLHLCVATNGSGAGWAGDTAGSNVARGSGYSAIDNATRPYLTNASALSNCYEGATNRGTVAANRASYLGTFFSSAAGQTLFQFGTTDGTLARFLLWNAYSRVALGGAVWTALSSYSFGAIAWREAGGGFAHVDFVAGLSEDVVKATGQVVMNTGSVTNPLCDIGIGVDGSTSTATTAQGFAQASPTNSFYSTLVANYRGYPGVGRHTVAMNEVNGSGSGVCIFFGAGQGGIFVDLSM